MRNLIGLLILSTLISTTSVYATTARPTQYVALAFDGSLNLNFWDESLEFARANDVKFTYFASGVYFLENDRKDQYVNPSFGPGKSAIGFGGSADHILQRVDKVNQAYNDGHEIGSHVNGHFAGAHTWSYEQWQSEFTQFYQLFMDVFHSNGITSEFIGQSSESKPYVFDQDEIIGFRSPLLEYNDEMYRVLDDHHYRYDTSKTNEMTYWPQKQNGIWNFPLATVTIAGTGKHTISMDYNFFYAQSKGKEDPANSDLYSKQMYDTYMNYFSTNYHGNRAPIHIGHHFSQWNGGAYWRAMKKFAQTVCHLPEVQCVTYRELTAYMDGISAETLAQYKSGNFDKLSTIQGRGVTIAEAVGAQRPLDANLELAADDGSVVHATVSGADAASVTKLRWKLDGKGLAAENGMADLSGVQGSVLSVSAERDGAEILSATHTLTVENGRVHLSALPLEARALQGDMPEAHAGEQD